MVQVRTPITTTVTWGETATDVSAAVVTLRTGAHGSGRNNPDRSTIRPARGTLLLEGNEYRPGHADAVATVAQFNTRAAITVSQGSVILWEGFAEQPRILGPARTSWRLVGKLTERAHERITHAHTETTFPDDATWTLLLGQAPRLVGQTGVGITLAPFVFTGPAFLLLSRMGQLLGRLVGEDRLGRPTMPVFGRDVPTSDIIDLDGSVLMGPATTVSDANTVRNRMFFPFQAEGAELTLANDTLWSQWQAVVPDDEHFDNSETFTIDLDPPAGDTISDITVELLSAEGLAVDEWEYASSPGPLIIWSTQSFDISSHVTLSHSISGNEVTVTVDVTDPDDRTITTRRLNGPTQPDLTIDVSTGSWEGTAGTPPEGAVAQRDNTSAGAVIFQLRRWWGFDFRFRINYQQTGPTVPDNKTFINQASINEWGQQTLEAPLWVSNDGLDPGDANAVRIQDDLDHLAQPRTYHTIRIPLWQNTTALTERVGGVDYGDYVHLEQSDTTRNVNIDSVCVVTARNLDVRAGEIPAVTLELLETGQASP